MYTKIIISLMVFLLSSTSTIPQTKIFSSARDQAESPISINPTNSNNFVGTVITFVSPSFAKIGYYYSLDGGSTWFGNQDALGTASEGDPVIKFDPDGTVYVIYQVVSEKSFYMRKTTDGGMNWIPSLSEIADNIWLEPGTNDLIDRPWISISSIRNANDQFDIFISYTWLDKDESGILISTNVSLLKSTNGGATFQKIRTYFGNSSQYYLTGSFVEVDPNGNIFFAFSRAELNHLDVYEIQVYRSTNGGATFSDGKTIDVIQAGSSNPEGDHLIKQGTIRLDSYPRISIDHGPFNRGKVYLTWAAKSTVSGNSDIKFISGEEIGGSFSWDENPSNIDATSGEQWMPALSVSADGVLNIFYYSSGSLSTDPIYTYLKYSTNGGSTFSARINVGDPSGFVIPQSGNTFLGDYHGLTSWFGKVYALWSEYHVDPPNGEVQMYFKEVGTNEITIAGYNKVEVDQQDQGGVTFGKFGRWNQGLYTEYTAPHDFLFEVSGTEVIRASQEFKTGTYQKYHEWNTGSDVINHNVFSIDANTQNIFSSFSPSDEGITIKNNFLDAPSMNPAEDKIGFRDPWYIDFTDSYGNRNRGMAGAIFHDELNSPITFNQPEFENYLGVFRDQTIASGNYYSVRSPIVQNFQLSQTGKYHNFYFQNWSWNETDHLTQDNIVNGYYETPVVFRSSSATVIANLKGTQLSNNANTYKNTSQRKFIKTPDGKMYITYESMNFVWLERSTDNGSTWEIINGGKPIGNAEGISPCLDYLPDFNFIVLSWQQKVGWTFKLRYLVYNPSTDFYREGDVEWAGSPPPEGLEYTYDAQMVVSWNRDNDALFVWKGTQGLMLSVCILNMYDDNWRTSAIIRHSIPNFERPTLYCNKSIISVNNLNYFHLAYQYSNTEIHYRLLTLDVSDPNNIRLKVGSDTNVSANSGYYIHYNPTITGTDFVIGTKRNEYIRLAWIGYREAYEEGLGGGGGPTPEGESRVLYKYKAPVWWSYLHILGNNIASVSVNKGSNLIDYREPFAIAWSEWNTNSVLNKYVRSDASLLTPIKSLSTTGQEIQVNNSLDFYNMYVNAFNRSNQPFYFNLSENLSDGLEKIETIAIFKGREGIVIKDSTDFYYAIGDITLDGESIDFIALPDSILIDSTEIMNEYLVSEPFNVTNNSNLFYGVQYGIIDSVDASTALSDGSAINFKVELVDNQTSEVLGVFDEVSYSSENVFQYNNIGFQVDLSGIGNRTVRLRLKVATTASFDYAISNRFSDTETLNKSGYKQISYKENMSVKEYALEHNYPNPFNPMTTIKYQIPKSGNVTLKVYDILGNEVETLIDKQHSEGRYEVNFNASSLASGVYIYRLNVNDFVNVKKMILLK